MALENEGRRADLSSQVTKAGADYQGDGLAVTKTTDGARLRCVFQRLDGEATSDGLWLASTVLGQPADRFRVKAVALGRNGRAGSPLPAVGGASVPASRSIKSGAHGVTCLTRLPPVGEISVDGQTVRFVRPGLVEEYTVSMDGVRQDFVVLEGPAPSSLPSPPMGEKVAEGRLRGIPGGNDQLRLELAVTGAKVEPSTEGVQLMLEQSGRKIAYSRLRVTDATGKELNARMEAVGRDGFHSVPNSEWDAVERVPPTLAVVVDDAQAVYPIRIDPTFSDANWVSMGGIPGVSYRLLAAVVDGSGNLYIGGEFTVVGDVVANHIAKWNGSHWSALGAGMGRSDGDRPYVFALAVSGSDLYAGGKFTTAGGVAATNIAKWDGSSWSALGSGMNGYVNALAVSGSDLFAGGEFTRAAGVSASYVAKWNGSGWSALGSGMNQFGYVHALVVSGSDLYAGGGFTTAGGSPANYIAKWNGTGWSALGSGMNGTVDALAVSDSDVYAGGHFTTAGGVSASRIAKWNGSSWSALGSGMDQTVDALAVSGSDVFAGGWFTSAGGVSASRIAKWNGSNWSALGSGMNGNVNALAVSGSNLYAGGQFSVEGEVPASSVAKWNGSSWSALGSGMNGIMNALAVSGSNLYAGGSFTMVGGSPANLIAKWNGSSWSALGSGIGGKGIDGRYPSVYALAVSGGDLYAGGEFTTAGGVSATNIAKWDGSSWSALGSGIGGRIGGSYPSVYALAVSGGDLYVGGEFTTAGGVSATNIAKWDGSNWSALGSGMNSRVYALMVFGSDLYAGGWFTTAGGVPANYIAKWSGSTWSALGLGMASTPSPSVYALAASGSDLYAAGYFTMAGGSPATNIAKWNGSSWSTLGLGMGGERYHGIGALAVSGGDVYAGGDFTTAGAIAANYIAKWNGSSWSALGSGMGGNDSFNFPKVKALAVSGSDLYAGGFFRTAGGKVSAYIARAVLGDAPGYNQLTGRPVSGNMEFSYIGYPATNYALDRTFDLSPPISWVGQETNTMTVSGVLQFTNTPVPGTNNFWRVRSVP